MSRRLKTVLAASLIALTTFGTQIAVSTAGNRNVVAMGIAFTPKEVSIRTGSSVTFKFLDLDTDHNVMSVGTKRFKGISARTTGSVKRTFRRGGIYRYECTLHPGMTGRIKVR